MTRRDMIEDYAADALEVGEEAADAARALDHLREIEKLARLWQWREVLELLGQIEELLPEV